MLNILIVTSYLPWPISEGGRVAQLRVLQSLRNDSKFTIIYPVIYPGGELPAHELAEKFPQLDIIPVPVYEQPPKIQPLPLRAKIRKQLVRLLRRLFPVPKVSNNLNIVQKKAPFPWYIFQPVYPNLVDELERQIESKKYDIVQIEFTDLMSLGVAVSNRIPSIFVHHQLHFMYEQRCSENGASNSGGSRYLRERMRLEEREYLKLFDRVITFSDVDERLLNEFCPGIKAVSSPFPTPEDPVQQVEWNSAGWTSLCILASEGNPPNVQGLDRFMREVWPILKIKYPGLKIEVIGKWSDCGRSQVHAAEDLEYSGFVPDLRTALKNKIMLVPVWIGSGIRTKILAAWAAACPVITTSVGVEGLPGRPGEDYFVADSAEDFVNCCRELVENHEKRNKIAKNGWNIAKEHFSLEAVRQKRLSIYNELIGK